MHDSNHLLIHYLRAFIAYGRLRLLVAFILLALVGLTEGIGLLMLVPMLHLVGFNTDSQSSSIIANKAEQYFAALNLPLTLETALLLYVALIIFRSLLLYFRDLQLSEIRLGFVDHLRIKLYRAIGKANWLFLSKKRSSDLSHTLTADINRIATGTTFILELIVASVIAVVHIIVAFQISVLMTGIALFAGSILLLLLLPQVQKAKHLGSRLTEANREVFSTVSDFFNGIKLAKSYSAEAQYAQSFDDSLLNLRTQLLAFIRSNAFAQMMYQIGVAISLSLFFYFSATVLKTPATQLLVLVLVFSRLLPLLAKLQRSYQQIVHMLPAYASAIEIQHECERQAENFNQPGNWQPSLNESITLEKIQFHYHQPVEILKNFSLTIKAQQTIGIAGVSGAGKSTLADLYAGLITQNSGKILIDDHVFTTEDQWQWRAQVAYVPQETFLFNDSIRNNLLWAYPDASPMDLDLALKRAAAYQFVANLPQGMDTVIGERGTRLSGGERQRIALARALLGNPLLLILDEATSALDNRHDRQIQQAIENLHGELTIIIIAHRLSTLKHADQIIVLEQGKLAEKGQWNELMQQRDGHLFALANDDHLDLDQN